MIAFPKVLWLLEIKFVIRMSRQCVVAVHEDVRRQLKQVERLNVLEKHLEVWQKKFQNQETLTGNSQSPAHDRSREVSNEM